MEFEGKITKTGSVSRVYETVGSGFATHLKEKDGSNFYEITKDLVIKRKRIDDEGNPVDEVIDYWDIGSEDSDAGEAINYQYVCVVKDSETGKDKEVSIEPKFYGRLSFMARSDKGSYVRSEDGMYVKKSEVGPPAFKVATVYDGHNLLMDRTYKNECYACPKYLITPDQQKIIMPNDNVKYVNKKWIYTQEDGSEVECEPRSRLTVGYVLIDDEQIVDISKMQEENGKFFVLDESGKRIDIGQKDYTIEQGIVESSVLTVDNELEKVFKPHNIQKQRVRAQEQEGNLVYTWPEGHEDESGLTRVEVNKSRTVIKFFYKNKTVKVYAEYGANVPKQYADSAIRVQKFNIIDLGDDGIKVEFLQKTNMMATNIEFKDGKLNSYRVGDANISDIKWSDGEDYSYITSYTIDGIKISDIEWQYGEVGKCKIHFIDEDGTEVIEEVSNLKDSRYKDLAITYNVIDKIEDLKVVDGKLSFKMGKYKFSDAELKEDGTIGMCKLKIGSTEQEIDLSTDPRFKNLKFAVSVTLDQARVKPLLESEAIKMEDGRYKVEADYIQQGAMENGIARATKLNSVEQAMNARKEFNAIADKNKFRTFVKDENGNVHYISDFENTYEGISEFTNESDVFAKALGNTKIKQSSKGKITLDTKKADETRDSLLMAGIGLCGFQFGIIGLAVGPLVLTAGIITSIAQPIYRAIRRAQLENKDIAKLTRETQKDAEKHCKSQVKELVRETNKQLKALKAMYPQAVFEQKQKELIEQFNFEFDKIAAGLGMLGKGKLSASFDLSKKSKLTAENYPAYLECMRIRRELKNGRADRKKNIREHRKALRNAKKVDLDAINQERDKKGLPKLKSVKDYKKQLKLDYNKDVMEWGSYRDKIKAYKNTPGHTRKGLKELRQSLKKEMNSVKVDSVQFDELKDRRGEPVAPKRMRDLMAFKQQAIDSYNQGHRCKKNFDYGFASSSSKGKDQEELASPEPITQALAKTRDSVFETRLDIDNSIVEQRVKKVEERLSGVSGRVTSTKEKVDVAVKTRNFEQAYILGVVLRVEDRKVAENCNEAREYVNNTPNPELAQSRIDGAISNITDITANSRAQVKKVLKLEGVGSIREKYAREVESQAYDAYARNHKEEFKKFVEGLRAKAGKDAKISVSSLKAAFYHEVCKDEEARKQAEVEFETYKVEYDIEENIMAEVYCEQEAEDYAKFVERLNAKGANLDPNSEDAKCRYYAHCKMFKKSISRKTLAENEDFMKKVDKKAEERLEAGLLKQHEKQQEEEKTVRFRAKRHINEHGRARSSSSTHSTGREADARPSRTSALTPDYSAPVLGM